MVQTQDQLVALNKANFEAALRFAAITLDGAERMLGLQLETTKSALSDSAKAAQALSSVKDLQELNTVRTNLVQPSVQKAATYAKSLYEVAASTQTELTRLVEEQVSEFNRNVAVTLESAVRAAPVGSEVAVAAVKSAVAAANSAYDTLSRAIKQAADLTQAGIAAAATTTQGQSTNSTSSKKRS